MNIFIKNLTELFTFSFLANLSILKLGTDLTQIEIRTGNFCYRSVSFLRRSGGPEKFSCKIHTLPVRWLLPSVVLCT